jgi:hypothetical protein
MKIERDHLNSCCSGVSPNRRRTNRLLYNRICRVGFPFPIRNISGQGETYGNDRKKGLSFRDAFTRNLGEDKTRFLFILIDTVN